MAEGILGLGGSGSASLNQELIDKLKSAEAKAQIDPWTEKLENWDLELEKTTEISDKLQSMMSKLSLFNLDVSGADAFEQMTASTSGTAASFSANDVSGLTPGTTEVTITQLAQKDVYQTSTFTDKTALIADGQTSGDQISITHDGITYDFSTVDKTYEDLATEIGLNDNFTASVEQVSDTEYRLVIKSAESGEANALTIATTGVDLGFGDVTSSYISDFTALMGAGKLIINGNEVVSDTEFMSYDQLIDEINTYGGGVYTATKVGDTIEINANDGSAITITEYGDNGLSFTNTSHVLEAQNMTAEIDGIDYNVSSNSITIQGVLEMTALEVGTSSITLQRDTSSILSSLEEFAQEYNDLVDIVATESLSADGVLEDTSSIKMILQSIKDMLFKDDWGENSDKNVFTYGFNLDTSGHLSIDVTTFSEAIVDDFDGLKDLFIGTEYDYTNSTGDGLGTMLYKYLDDLDSFDGFMTNYTENLLEKQVTYQEELDKAQETLDNKYELMAAQFAEYTAIINQMEAAFGGMKMMIEQSTASN
jgi:flagellar hook-associated protein 2